MCNGSIHESLLFQLKPRPGGICAVLQLIRIWLRIFARRSSSMKTKILIPFLVLALAGMACDLNIDLPRAQKPGPDVTDQIEVPSLGAEETRLTLSFGAGKLTLAPGAAKN